jgi:hypothetical protein
MIQPKREFFVNLDTGKKHFDCTAYTCWSTQTRKDASQIHVIEYSALTEAQEKIKELKYIIDCMKQKDVVAAANECNFNKLLEAYEKIKELEEKLKMKSAATCFVDNLNLRKKAEELEQLIKDIAPSWLPENIRDRRRKLLK